MNKNIIVAIDGPVGSGKSTVAKFLAAKLGFLYIDTGAMYRAVTLKVMRNNIELTNTEKIAKLAQDTDIKLVQQNNKLHVYLDNEDVSEAIRAPEVSRNTSPVCDIKDVRKRLVALQQEMGNGGNIVMEGRDISTVVFPQAKKKFYLDASLDERAKRRFLELQNKGFKITLEEVKKDIITRDERDKTRELGALKKHPDAVIIDSTSISPEDVVNKMFDIVLK
ncbi:MAG: (d)CMP kinase [Candidatus Firestonebacteria bacterium]|nr:(d)CMP kinase [Candidatus Firestonebacteria bacterium]